MISGRGRAANYRQAGQRYTAGSAAAIFLTASIFSGPGLIQPVPSAEASGFAIFTHGAKELAMLNAVVAHTEGPASNFYNPALIAELPGSQLEIGTTLIMPNREFTGAASGVTVETDDEVFFPSSLFATHRLNDYLTAGFGVCNTFGLGTEWPANWEGRYVATNAELETFNFNPNLAWKINDRLALAGGLNFLTGDASLANKINLGLADGLQIFDGDGHGWGYNLGLLFNINDAMALGLSYRSKIDLKLEGDVAFFPAVMPADGGSVNLALPPQVSAGLSYKLRDNLLVEVSGRWEGWSRYKSLTFNFNNLPQTVVPKDWDDVFAFMFGVKYNLDADLAVAVGYLHEENPVPDIWFEPAVTDADKDMFSIGFQKNIDRYTVALTYLYGIYEDRPITVSALPLNPAGEYKQDIHMLGASVAMKF